jgi:aryl-phospho-beta-D-glucosidase BglC (GH1 family)
MKKFLDKAKSKLQELDSGPRSSNSQPQQFQQPLPQNDEASTLQPPAPIDIIRYRYHHGTNLGSIFVLERWLHGSMFPASSAGGSEYDAISASLKEMGVDATREKWETHWRNAITDSEFEWLAREAKCTSIRLPIGYFTLGRQFTRGTIFEGIADTGVYDGAWAAVRDLVTRARSWGIGVLLDLHALPGGANKDEHSGTTSGKAEFWESRRNQDLGKSCAGFLARETLSLDGVIGIQLVNEAGWGAKGMYEWYEEAILEIARVDQGIPVYISDAWNLKACSGWTNERHALKGGPRNPVVIDTHKYYTFDEKDRSRAPQEIIQQIPGELGQLDGKDGSLTDRGEAQVIIGEYSCVLDGRTWGRVPGEEKAGLVQQFGRAQSQRWQQRTGGSYFWTYKMDWMDGGEWGFAQQSKAQNIIPPHSLTLNNGDVQGRVHHAWERRNEMHAGACRGHENYWNQTSPGQHFEHQRYSDGWLLGYSDATAFFAARSDGKLGNRAGEGGDKIGCLEIWVKKRLLESGQRGPFVWEWEQGFRAGVHAFYETAGI